LWQQQTRSVRDPEKTQAMKKRKTPPRPAKKKTPAATRPKKNKPVAIRTEEPKPAVSSGEPEVQRAIPLGYVTTDEVGRRSALGRGRG
jgi:hypothetical protein